ncbi:hypothetical protein DASC09_033480 [Saccharomycopsis crataegensis]|uniref:Uncharacterized protein n=1 Tax=Saccharomycopsis crataegensis TaxID=43959 RepID=A0AAV5QML8_9ASCO|nr:hypothetical protein DASC09_033480 [Saccharomycopsis crataegensis]
MAKKGPYIPPAPKEIQKRYWAFFALFGGLYTTIVMSVPFYRKYVLGEDEYGIRRGEILPNGQIRIFSEYEIQERERERKQKSWLYQLFGNNDK